MIKYILYILFFFITMTFTVYADSYYLGQWVWNSEGFWGAPHSTEELIGSLDLRSNTQCGKASGTPEGYGVFVYKFPITDSNLFSLGTNLDSSISIAKKNQIITLLNLDSISATTYKDVLWEILTFQSDSTGINRVKTLMPDSKGNLEFFIARKKIISKKLIPFESPEWAKILEVMQLDYANLRKYDLKRDSQNYKKVLGGWIEQFGIADHTIFLAKGIPNEEWDYPTTSISENFNCADSNSSLNCQLTWVNDCISDSCPGNVYGIKTNRGANEAANSHTVASRAQSDLSSSNQTVSSIVVAVNAANSSSNNSGVAARYSTSVRDFYTAGVGYRNDNSFKIIFVKFVAGIGTVLDTEIAETDQTPTAAVKITVNGSTMQSEYGGVKRHNFTDTSISGNIRAGIESRDTGSIIETTLLDDWSASDIEATRLRSTWHREGIYR